MKLQLVREPFIFFKFKEVNDASFSPTNSKKKKKLTHHPLSLESNQWHARKNMTFFFTQTHF